MGEQRNPTTQIQDTQRASTGAAQVPITRRASGSGKSSGLERQPSTGGLGWSAGSSPFSMMRRMMEDMDRMFEDFGFRNMRPPFGRQGSTRMGQASAWSPEIEVRENE